MVLKPLVPYFSHLNTYALTMWGEDIPNNSNKQYSQVPQGVHGVKGVKYMKQEDEPGGM